MTAASRAPIEQAIAGVLSAALADVLPGSADPASAAASFETPREEKFGDLSSHVALKAAKQARQAPRPLAERLAGRVRELLAAGPDGARISSVSVEGPGFLNFTYSPLEIASVVERVEREGAGYGKPAGVRPRNVLLEYVSANPTGPLTVAHGRQAALGDALAKILRYCGHRVTTEYYNNDEGVQITTLGRSLRARCLAELGSPEEFPEDGYKGGYLIDLAKELVAREGGSLKDRDVAYFSRHARDVIMESIVRDLRDFGVTFDGYYSQEALGKSGKVEETLRELREKGHVYDQDGAAWFASTRFGDDKDRVLVKSDGHYTYLTPDIAYHRDKFGRGFDLLVNILGPDHHGYIARIKAACDALGHSSSQLEIKIAQLVTLYEGDKQMRMSTRAGEFVTLREILDEVGSDAGRFFFLMRRFDQHLDFDLALAKSQTPENPVFYVQYAHARIENVRRTFEERGLRIDARPAAGALDCLREVSEVQLMRLLRQFPDHVLGAEKTLEPYRVVPFLRDLAAAYHRFYTDHRVVTDDAGLTQARMRLSLAVQTVLRTGLGLLGVSAPVKM